MAEYFINSEPLQTKIRQTLPSQGGAGAGVDLSASTTIIPIIDLTETAEGSTVRQDLRRSANYTDITSFNVANQTTTILNTTGWFNIRGGFTCTKETSGTDNLTIALTDGVTPKTIFGLQFPNFGIAQVLIQDISLDIFLGAGESCTVTAGSQTVFNGYTKQIADINGVLTTVS